MRNEVVEKIFSEMEQLFDATDEALNEWTGEGNLQIPVLLGMVSLKLNLDEKQVRKADPFIREYVRNHPDWYVTRGAHGGIMKSAEKNKKEKAKAEKMPPRQNLRL